MEQTPKGEHYISFGLRPSPIFDGFIKAELIKTILLIFLEERLKW